jgi:hypothetical protein
VWGAVLKGKLAMAYSCVGKAQTTIGAGGLNCRVRDGTGCTSTAAITNSPATLRPAGAVHSLESRLLSGPPGTVTPAGTVRLKTSYARTGSHIQN